MGGRSREPDRLAKAYAFVSDLSDDRLENYGKMTSIKYQNAETEGSTLNGKPGNSPVFNEKLADEYEKRTGVIPAWDIRHNDAKQHRRESERRADEKYTNDKGN